MQAFENFFDETVYQLINRQGSDYFAMPEKQAAIFAAGNAKVGLFGFARPVNRAAHHRNLKRAFDSLKALFNGPGDLLQRNLTTPAGRA